MARMPLHWSVRPLVSLKPPPASWVDVISETAEQFMTATVCFYGEGNGSDIDPVAGTGDAVINLIWVGPARVQHLRSPQRFATDYQAEANRPFRFQLPKGDNVPFLPQGTKARVLDAGSEGDASLEDLSYVVDSAINSSFQAVHTIELTATMRKTDWEWDTSTLYPPILHGQTYAGTGIADIWWIVPGWNYPTSYMLEQDGEIIRENYPYTLTTVRDLTPGEHTFRVDGQLDGWWAGWSNTLTLTVE